MAACGARFSAPPPFFFQAADGIRSADVTGVQTCALPISLTYEQHAAFTSFLLNAVHGYRTAQEIVGQGGGPVQVQAQPAKVEDILRNMDDEQRAALFEIGRASCRERV